MHTPYPGTMWGFNQLSTQHLTKGQVEVTQVPHFI